MSQTWPLTQVEATVLVVSDCTHALTSDQITSLGHTESWSLAQVHTSSGITIQDASHALTSDEVALQQYVVYDLTVTPTGIAYTLVVSDCTHAMYDSPPRSWNRRNPSAGGWGRRSTDSGSWTERIPSPASWTEN